MHAHGITMSLIHCCSISYLNPHSKSTDIITLISFWIGNIASRCAWLQCLMNHFVSNEPPMLSWSCPRQFPSTPYHCHLSDFFVPKSFFFSPASPEFTSPSSPLLNLLHFFLPFVAPFLFPSLCFNPTSHLLSSPFLHRLLTYLPFLLYFPFSFPPSIFFYMAVLSLMFHCVYWGLYARDGVGNGSLKILGEFLPLDRSLAEWLTQSLRWKITHCLSRLDEWTMMDACVF